MTLRTPSNAREYVVPFFVVSLSVHHSSSLSTNPGGPSSERRIGTRQLSLLAEDGHFYTEAEKEPLLQSQRPSITYSILLLP